MAQIAVGILGAGLASLGAIGGGPAGAALGFSIGMALGGILFPPDGGSIENGKISDVRVQNSSYQAPIAIHWGRGRLAGNVIWAKKPQEHKKKAGGNSGSPKVTNYTYSQHFAVMVCAGPVGRIRRIWAETKVIYDDRPEVGPLKVDKSVGKDNVHIHLGSYDQPRDDLMVELDGAEDTPAYRGRCYVVFEAFNITKWGNTIPNLTFEVEGANGIETLDVVLSDLWRLVGGQDDEIDFSELSSIACRGLTVSNQTQLTSVFAGLETAYVFDMTESDWVLRARRRGGSSLGPIPDRYLGASSDADPSGKVALSRSQEVEVPNSVDVSFVSEANDYQGMTVHAARQYGLSEQKQTITIPVLLTEDEANHLALMAVHLAYLQRNAVAFSLPWRFFHLTPGDVVDVPTAAGNMTIRVVEMTLNLLGPIEVLGVEEEPSLYVQNAPGPDLGRDPGTLGDQKASVFEALETTAALDALADSDGFYLAGTGGGSPWPGEAITVSPALATLEGSTSDVATLEDAADLGYAANALPEPRSYAPWDRESHLDVTMYEGTPASRSDLDVLNGANTMIVGQEIVQFTTVASLGGGVYRLTNLLRGRRGSEWAGSLHQIGEPVVFLDRDSSTFIPVKPVEVGRAHTYSGREIDNVVDDPTTRALTLRGLARMPYSPVHLNGVSVQGDLVLTWVRRARKEGEWTDGQDVPLDEATERYLLEVLDSGESFTVQGSPTFTYTAAMQNAAFGGARASLSVRVRQIADDGRLGFPISRVVPAYS